MFTKSSLGVTLAVLLCSGEANAMERPLGGQNLCPKMSSLVDAELNFKPLVQLHSSETEPFQWRENVEAILKDYQESQENRAKILIDSGNWASLQQECGKTKAAATAIQKLDHADFRLLPDGRIIPKYVFVSVVPFTQ